MPDRAHLIAFLAAAIVLAVLPGPGLLYVLGRSLGSGTRAGLHSSAGTALGGLVHVIAAALGLSAVVLASARAFELVKLAGAGYLIWIGIRTLRSAARSAPAGDPDPGRNAVRQGVLTEALNPKTALFMLTFLPQFAQPGRGLMMVQLVLLGTASVLLNSAADVVVALLSGRLGALLHRSPRWWRRQRIGSGLLLIGLGGAAAASGARSS